MMMKQATEPQALRMQELISRLVKNYQLCDEACLARHGVTCSQGYTLLAFPTEGTISMNELSEAMGLASSTMTRMTDHLVRKGLAHRRHDDEDRRVVRVGLTPSGQTVRSALEKARQDLFGEVLAGIDRDERVALLGTLDRLSMLLGNALGTCCAG